MCVCVCVSVCLCVSISVLSWRVGVGEREIFACSLPKKGLKFQAKIQPFKLAEKYEHNE